jgi:hypothetical protein
MRARHSEQRKEMGGRIAVLLGRPVTEGGEAFTHPSYQPGNASGSHAAVAHLFFMGMLCVLFGGSPRSVSLAKE